MMRAVAARRTGTEVIGVAACPAAAGEILSHRAVALFEFVPGGRDVVGDPVRDPGARLAVDVVHQDREASGSFRRILPGKLRPHILARAGADLGRAGPAATF